MSEKNKSKTIEITRIYEAPLEVVWDAWCDPKQAAHWWGPRGFTITTHSKELKVGGIWHYTMHGPDGVDYPNKTKYLEVEKHSRLVYDHGGNDEQAPMFRVTVQFTKTQGKTKMKMSMALPTPEAAAEARKFVKKAGGNATWDRLAEFLEKQNSGKEQFVINRSFEAPINKVYDMWTRAEHLAQWLPPTGMKMKFIETDIKPGGTNFYMMSTDDNSMKMYGKMKYLEMKSPSLIKYSQEFTDEAGNTARHPLAPSWPESMLTTVILAEEEADMTRVTVTWEVDQKCNAEELATFVREKSGMTQGWNGSFDKLEEYLISTGECF